ncbi:uncharacterized protein LOC124410531 [Diprion similis]|uniref:uncharacterized protein LOC124410531 n=1 Tax=Diprion similis TaxID=362088 RepID=UPI001EF8F312|nr:uncharacterized protein LOC124410531 [Diprion similis]
MSFDWKTIGEQVSSLHLEMNCPSEEYTIQQLKTDLEIVSELDPEKKKYLANDVNCDYGGYKCDFVFLIRIARFKKSLEDHRGFLTKLFTLANNSNGVDTLIVYCDYYKNEVQPEDAFIKKEINIPYILGLVFKMLGYNDKITVEILNDVWGILSSYVSSLDVYSYGKYNLFPLSVSVANMVIMADADLSAAVLAFIRSRNSYFGISRVLVQEPVMEKLVDTARIYGCKIEVLSDLYVFRNSVEALGNLHGSKRAGAISVWSENIIAAKKFAAEAEICTIWINAHGELHPGLESLTYSIPPFFDYFVHPDFKTRNDCLDDDCKTAKTFDLFYGGQWQTPAEGKYWTNPANTAYAQATGEDLKKCTKVARSAFKIWRSTEMRKRAQTIKCFAKRLQANGESEYADLIIRLVDLPLVHGTSASIVKDGWAEILTTREPVGVVVIASNDQNELFERLVVASVTGNAVIVLFNSKSCVSFAPYCDMLATCGFPAGVINCLFTNGTSILNLNTESINKVLGNLNDDLKLSSFDSCKVNDIFRTRYYMNIYKKMFNFVTKPKSVWLQRG